MIVEPYNRTPAVPLVALLTGEGRIVSEQGELLEPDEWPKNARCWVDYDTVVELYQAGQGEVLCWNGEPIRWRHARLDEEGWNKRQSDVAVIRLPFGDDTMKTLRSLGLWRDWLARHGASPTGTSGSAAWSLLRATLTSPLYCSLGAPPPLVQTMGGRIELGPAGSGSFEGDLCQVDLSAAYARELAGLSYGGSWVVDAELPGSHGPDWWAQDNRAVFVKATLSLPGAAYGPLVRRPRKRMSQLALFLSQLHEDRYPQGCRLSGLWTWQELEAALEQGATIVKLDRFWVQLASQRPFRAWWEAIEEGRAMPGLAGLLAKVTGNALWGRFCMDTRAQGERRIRSVNSAGRVVSRILESKGGLSPAHDLAETVSGRVRAELYRLMMAAGDDLLSAHTDGAWIKGDGDAAVGIRTRDRRPAFEGDPRSPACGLHDRPGESDGDARRRSDREASRERLGDIVSDRAGSWRVKQPARRLDLIDPQRLRYWSSPPAPWDPAIVYAGVPTRMAEHAFQTAWEKMP